jgi:hypothetical protein
MEEIGKHEDPTAGSLTSSPFIRHVGFLTFRVVVFVVCLKFNEKRRKRTFESGSDVALPTQCVEDHYEETDQRRQAQG